MSFHFCRFCFFYTEALTYDIWTLFIHARHSRCALEEWVREYDIKPYGLWGREGDVTDMSSTSCIRVGHRTQVAALKEPTTRLSHLYTQKKGSGYSWSWVIVFFNMVTFQITFVHNLNASFFINIIRKSSNGNSQCISTGFKDKWLLVYAQLGVLKHDMSRLTGFRKAIQPYQRFWVPVQKIIR